MKYKILLLCYFLSNIIINARGDDFTTLYSTYKSIETNQKFHVSESLFIDNIDVIDGLSIDGRIIQYGKDSFIRVILEDEEGRQYQVLECEKMLNNKDTIILKHYCEETSLVYNVKPKVLKCYLKNALLEIGNINYSIGNLHNISYKDFCIKKEEIKRHQVEQIVKQINKHNQKEGKLWIAGITENAMKDYQIKKRIYGLNDNESSCGIEYYADGVFELGELSSNQMLTSNEISSNFVECFDWRNRHGNNWMTSVKHQGDSGYCVAFAINSMLEACTNLYFNTNANLDLSEQDIVYNYARQGYKNVALIYDSGMNVYDAMTCTSECSVIDESSEPFVDEKKYSIPPRPQYSYAAGFNSFNHATNENDIKRALITKGPCVSGINTSKIHHAMALVGFHTIQVGDTLRPVKTSSEGGLFPPIIVQANSPYIGQTYWIFKDNYGEDIEGRINGYMNLIFHSYSNMYPAYFINGAIDCSLYTDSDINVVDNDGDGFYFWGIGPKPSHCPSWVPDTPDGDDSDYTKGPMDNYGFLLDLPSLCNDTIFINNDSLFDHKRYLYQHTVVNRGASLVVNGDITFYNDVTLTVRNGGRLVIDSAISDNSSIIVEQGGEVLINNAGGVNLQRRGKWTIPLGAKMKINNGFIKQNTN